MKEKSVLITYMEQELEKLRSGEILAADFCDKSSALLVLRGALQAVDGKPNKWERTQDVHAILDAYLAVAEIWPLLDKTTLSRAAAYANNRKKVWL